MSGASSTTTSAATAGALQAVNTLVSMGPALLVPIVAARLASQRPVLLAIASVAAAGVLGLLLAPGAGLLWVALIGLGQGGQIGLALILPALRRGGPQVVASLTAMTFSAGYMISATGPWILGIIHDATGNWSAPLAAMLAITLLQLVPGAPACRNRIVGLRPAAAGNTTPEDARGER